MPRCPCGLLPALAPLPEAECCCVRCFHLRVRCHSPSQPTSVQVYIDLLRIGTLELTLSFTPAPYLPDSGGLGLLQACCCPVGRLVEDVLPGWSLKQALPLPASYVIPSTPCRGRPSRPMCLCRPDAAAAAHPEPGRCGGCSPAAGGAGAEEPADGRARAGAGPAGALLLLYCWSRAFDSCMAPTYGQQRCDWFVQTDRLVDLAE